MSTWQEKRKFNGEIFYYIGKSRTKAIAKKWGRKIKSNGGKYRIIKFKEGGISGYAIYRRQKGPHGRGWLHIW